MKLPVRPLLYSVIALAASAYAVAELAGPKGVSALMSNWEQIRQLEQENNDIRNRIAEKRKRILMLEEQHDAIDIEVRRELQQVRKHEKVLILEGQPKSPAPTDPSTPPSP